MKQLNEGILFTVLWLPLLSVSPGCVYGPKTKDKTFLESLNGKHYESPSSGQPSSIGQIPVVKRRRANVRISGKLSLVDENIPLPLSHREILLIQESKVCARTRSETNGSFVFFGDFIDGPAFIRLESEQYMGEIAIQIKGFEVGNLDLYAKKKF